MSSLDYLTQYDIARIEQRRRKRDRLPERPGPAVAMDSGAALRGNRPLSEFLSADDVERLTGYRQPSRQQGWFEKNGIEFKVPWSGRPLVHISAIDKNWRQPEPDHPVALPIPPLDREAVYRPIAEIRLMRARWTPGCGPHSGVYFLFDGFTLVYVGLSVNVAARLRAHRMNYFDRTSRVIWFTLWAAIEVPEYWLEEVESHYIAEHQPPLNIRGIRR